MPVWVLIVTGQIVGQYVDPGSCMNAIRHLSAQQVNSGAICRGPIDSSVVPAVQQPPQQEPGNIVCVEAMPGQLACYRQ